eukprot:6492402-Amphidinium_carterae.3
MTRLHEVVRDACLGDAANVELPKGVLAVLHDHSLNAVAPLIKVALDDKSRNLACSDAKGGLEIGKLSTATGQKRRKRSQTNSVDCSVSKDCWVNFGTAGGGVLRMHS